VVHVIEHANADGGVAFLQAVVDALDGGIQ